MRINKFVAQATGLSRRSADRVIEEGRVTINQAPASLGSMVHDGDTVALDNRRITPAVKTLTIMLNKPTGYVCSREGQGSKTVYDLLPSEYRQLKTIGRLDKYSSGLLLLSNDGTLAHQLTHPSYAKMKIYEVTLDRELAATDQKIITGHGVTLEDGPSAFELEPLGNDAIEWRVSMREGRNRQIRRTFSALGYRVTKLHRTHFGDYLLNDLKPGNLQVVG